MKSYDRIFLVGPMGAGKTTIGRRLASRLHLEFIDLDAALEERTGVDIPRIFDIEGEAGFRRRERQLLDELTQRKGIVLATGGGAIVDPENQSHLGSRGLVIYLRASLETQTRRTHGTNRPMLNGDDPAVRLSALMQTRGPLYEALADRIIDTEDGHPERLAEELAHALEESGIVDPH